MKEAGSWIVALAGIALAIFFLQIMAVIVAPGLMAAYLYVGGMKKLFDLRDGSAGMIFHFIVGTILALALMWFLFSATGLYKSYFM